MHKWNHSTRLRTHRRSAILSLAALAMLPGIGCDEAQVILPASLDTPNEIAISAGNVCMDLEQISDEGLVTATTRPCARPDTPSTQGLAADVRERGAIGLVPNAQTDRVAIVALDLRQPTLVDLELASPGVTHIPVGKHPVSIATSPGGEVAYTANQLGKSLSVINVFALAATTEDITLPGIPSQVRVSQRTGQIFVNAPRLDAGGAGIIIRDGVTCEPDGEGPFTPGETDPEKNCANLGQEADLTILPTPGIGKDLEMGPRGERAYLTYADKPYLSIFATDDATLAPDEACLTTGESAPCEIARVGLTYGCSDGVDNDGDGKIDQEDAQCFGPLGAESPEGIGRSAPGACSDGVDNDGDGEIDRLDDDCHDSSQSSEEADADTPFNVGTTACSDGVDNDGDGLADLFDEDCYGPRGRSESPGVELGFDQVSVDDHGVFLYVTQTTRRQVLIVDLAKKALVDAPRSASSPYPFADALGVVVARQSVPSAIDARIRRVVSRDPRAGYDDSHALVRYELGAHVTADNGFVYYVSAATIYCDLYESGEGGLLGAQEFYTRRQGLDGYQEANCLTVPPLPLDSPARDVASCESVLLCQSCLAGTDPEDPADDREFMRCSACERVEEASFSTQTSACALDARASTNGSVRQMFNPRFIVRDAFSGASARETGRATCDLPAAFSTALQQYATQNPSEGSAVGCGSPLIPQPVALTVPTTGSDAPDDFSGEERFSLLEQRSRRLIYDEEGRVTGQVAVNTEDFRIRDEEWSVTFEGVLPGTRRGDGLAGEEDEGVFDLGTVNVCLSDVRVGDRLILRSEPGTDTDGVPAGCEDLVAPDDAREDFLSYAITAVRDGEISIETIDAADGEEPFSSALPSRECFPKGISYEIRPVGVWLVSGSESGIASGKRRVDGVCVPGNGAPSPRVGSRAVSGEVFHGPTFSFYLHPGKVAPVRDLGYTVGIERNFSSASTTSTVNGQVTIDTDSLRPSFAGYLDIFLNDAATVRAYDATDPDATRPIPTYQQFFLTVDPSDDAIFIKNMSTNDNPYVLR